MRWTSLKKLHQCNQTSHLNDLNNSNNSNYYGVTDKIKAQLEKANIKKRSLIRNIYREYELYLNSLRNLLYISAEKGLKDIYSYLSVKDDFLNENQFFCVFEEKISKIIYTNLPLLTVEQLKIKEIEKKLSGDSLDPSETLNYSNQKESLKIQIDKLKLEVEELKVQNGDQLQVMNDWENSLEDIKNQLINLSKIVKNEWDKIDKQIPDLEKEKLEFIATFPDELKELYDNLKKRGLEVIAAYRNENQCGCCGVELTSSEIEQILESKFQQCSYCDGVVI